MLLHDIGKVRSQKSSQLLIFFLFFFCITSSYFWAKTSPSEPISQSWRVGETNEPMSPNKIQRLQLALLSSSKHDRSWVELLERSRILLLLLLSLLLKFSGPNLVVTIAISAPYDLPTITMIGSINMKSWNFVYSLIHLDPVSVPIKTATKNQNSHIHHFFTDPFHEKCIIFMYYSPDRFS